MLGTLVRTVSTAASQIIRPYIPPPPPPPPPPKTTPQPSSEASSYKPKPPNPLQLLETGKTILSALQRAFKPDPNKVNGITEDFAGKLKSWGAQAEEFKNSLPPVGDTGLFRIPLEKLDLGGRAGQEVLEQMSSASDVYVDKVSSSVIHEIEKNPTLALVFQDQVKTNGPWDLKNADYAKYQGEQVKIGEKTFLADYPGNVAYGFTGAAAGFSEEMLRSMAGLNQIEEGRSKIGQDPAWSWEKSRGDDPRDQQAIRDGIMLYKMFGTSIEAKDLEKTYQGSFPPSQVVTAQYLVSCYKGLPSC